MNNNSTPEIMPHEIAFNRAIESGALNEKPSSDDYAGNYMYMYSNESGDFFKNIETRTYLIVPNKF